MNCPFPLGYNKYVTDYFVTTFKIQFSDRYIHTVVHQLKQTASSLFLQNVKCIQDHGLDQDASLPSNIV